MTNCWCNCDPAIVYCTSYCWFSPFFYSFPHVVYITGNCTFESFIVRHALVYWHYFISMFVHLLTYL